MEKKIEERFTELVRDLKAKYPDSRYPHNLWRLYQELGNIEKAIDEMHQIILELSKWNKKIKKTNITKKSPFIYKGDFNALY